MKGLLGIVVAAMASLMRRRGGGSLRAPRIDDAPVGAGGNVRGYYLSVPRTSQAKRRRIARRVG